MNAHVVQRYRQRAFVNNGLCSTSRDERLLSHHIQVGWRRELQLVKLKLAVRCLQSRICARHSGERATRRVKRRTRGGEVGGPQVAVREMERKLRMEESGARSLPRKALSQRVRVAFDRPPMGGNGWHWSAGDWKEIRVGRGRVCTRPKAVDGSDGGGSGRRRRAPS